MKLDREGARIRRAEDRADLDAVAELFRAYAASLPIDLEYQRFTAELANLPGAYAPPGGALFLARGPEALGCVAVRPLEEIGVCEMKRLFLLPHARGSGLGRALAKTAIEEARRLGYGEIRLDTLPSMQRAMAMYAEMGFGAIEPYDAPTPPGTVFLALTL